MKYFLACCENFAYNFPGFGDSYCTQYFLLYTVVYTVQYCISFSLDGCIILVSNFLSCFYSADSFQCFCKSCLKNFTATAFVLITVFSGLLQFLRLNFHVVAILLLQKISGLLHFLLIIFQAVAILVLTFASK